MNIEDYPTPLTDAVDSENEDFDVVYARMTSLASDLERKLAMCRDALSGFAATSSSSRVRRDAKQTLEETK